MLFNYYHDKLAAAEIKETYSEGPSIINAMSSKPIKHVSVLSQDHAAD